MTDIMVLTDSTGNDSDEWVAQWCTKLAAEDQSRTIIRNVYTPGPGWGSGVVVQTGQGNTYNVWQGAVAGADAQYHIDNAALILQYPQDVDQILVALGHNVATETVYNALVDLIVASWPKARTTLIYENAWLTLANDPWMQQNQYQIVTSVASANGFQTVDVWTLFDQAPDQSLWMQDDLHPNSVGSDQWATLLISEYDITATEEPIRVPVDVLADTPRYGTVAALKARLGIDGTTYDTELTQALVSAENAMDLFWGAGFDTSTVPTQVTQAAENVGVAVFKLLDTPFGVAGSNDYLGEISLEDEVRREMRTPLMRGFRVSWGVS